MIVLFTDFGREGPYLGQVEAVLAREAPGVPVINLFADLPCFRPRPAAYLLAAYYTAFPVGSVFLGVVDPGVGTDREAVVLKADGRWFVGPGNGLFEVISSRSREVQWWTVDWTPPLLSASFHGRDLFAPVAAKLARGEPVPGRPAGRRKGLPNGWPEDLAEIVYIDHYGNAMTGIRACVVSQSTRFEVGGRVLGRQRTFADATSGEPFWYENSNGLVEFAVNGERVADFLDLKVGDVFSRFD